MADIQTSEAQKKH